MIRGKRCSIFWAIGERRRRINHSWEHSHVCPKLFWVVLSSIRDKVLLAQRLSQALFISKFSRICVNESTCQKPRVSTHTRLCHRWEQRSPRISKERKQKALKVQHTHTLFLPFISHFNLRGKRKQSYLKLFVIVSKLFGFHLEKLELLSIRM